MCGESVFYLILLAGFIPGYLTRSGHAFIFYIGTAKASPFSTKERGTAMGQKQWLCQGSSGILPKPP